MGYTRCPKCHRFHDWPVYSQALWQRIPGGECLLRRIYWKCGGKCRYCNKRIDWYSYGKFGKRGHWIVDHGRPFSLCGTDSFRNLWPACWACNSEKSDEFISAPAYDRHIKKNGTATKRKRGAGKPVY